MTARFPVGVCGLVGLVGMLAACSVPDAPAPKYPAASTAPIWIDTDAACAAMEVLADPDDCVALAFAERLDLNIAGVSLTAGNAPLPQVRRTVSALGLANGMPIVQGGRSCDSPAVERLAEATAKRRLTILALGPLANIAAFARCYPERHDQVRRVIAVMARRPGQVFRPPDGILIVRDMNFEVHPAAARVVKAEFPVRYVGYEAGMAVQVPAPYVASILPRDVRDHIFQWSWLVRTFWGTSGMPQFDLTATAAFAWPEMFDCRPVRTRVLEGRLVAFPSPGIPTAESYCTPENGDRLIRTLYGDQALPETDL